jgi:hypothetical protein
MQNAKCKTAVHLGPHALLILHFAFCTLHFALCISPAQPRGLRCEAEPGNEEELRTFTPSPILAMGRTLYYKGIQLPQLRSYCAVATHGSFTARHDLGVMVIKWLPYARKGELMSEV